MYRHLGSALLRAAVAPAETIPKEWPDLTGDAESWFTWLRDVWSRNETAEAVTLASPTLARRVEDILAGTVRDVKRVRRAVVSVVGYVLRQTSRPTPFGLFAGVAPVEFGPATKTRWGPKHSAFARADAEWLAEVIAGLEACPELLERLTVTVNNLRSVRGGRLVLSSGTACVEVRHTPAVRAVERAALAPIRFGALVDAIAVNFPEAGSAKVRGMLTELVAQGFLVTSLRPAATVTDPLAHVIDRLREAQADEVAPVASTMRELRAVHDDLDRHNHTDLPERRQARASLVTRMRGLSRAANTPLAVDLRLDCDLVLPEQVAHELEAAAWALLRLTAQPGGPQAWRDYHAAFLDRYGIGTAVPVTDVVNPDTGLGLPAGYPGSLFDPPAAPASPGRDDRLHALVHHAAMDCRDEIVLDDEAIHDLGGEFDGVRLPSHVELSARIHAESRDALDRGEFTLTVSPARAGGTMTGRFVPDAGGGLAEVFRELPTIDADAVAAQLSFPPAFPHAGNIARNPRYLPYVIPLGEHRPSGEDGMIALADLVVTADWRRLYLVSASMRRPVEPQVFHALALDRQAPPVARFLANLPRASAAAYTEFGWGAAARLPHLPRVRYRRVVLSPARWRIDATDLPPGGAGWPVWRAALDLWRQRWRLPGTVELRDTDRVLRLDLAEPTHTAILRAHLNSSGEAVLTEASHEAGLGWLDGHAHEVAVPLALARPAQQSPIAAGRRLIPVTNHGRGHLPGAPDAQWLFAKVYLHPDRHSEVLAENLPRLLADLGGTPAWWFVRYRDPDGGHHLRLRIRVAGPDEHATYLAAVGGWAEDLRRGGVVRRLVLDTYEPEVGRYGDGPAMAAAESVFVADSAAVATQLRHIPPTAVNPTALTAASMVNLVSGFTGGTETGMAWLVDHVDKRPAPPAPAPRALLREAIQVAGPDAHAAVPGWATLAPRWHARRAALADYRQQLSSTADVELALESLLHLHHVRAIGLDRDSERVCRRLARAVALAWRAERERP